MTEKSLTERVQRTQRERFLSDVLAGLAAPQRSLPCKYFYDLKGSRLFDRITEQAAYYPTQAETDLLRAHAAEIAHELGPRIDLIELGSGSSIKTRLLLDALKAPQRYVPVDISADHLRASAKDLQKAYPDLRIEPVIGDYSGTIDGIAHVTASRRAVFFPGSSVGNFEPSDAVVFLRRIRELAGPDGVILIGVDLPKERAVLELAYDDPAGITAAFNLNLLERMQRELDAELTPTHFAHLALWQPEPSRMQIRLVAQRDTSIRVGGERFAFARGEHIVTEHCYKYSVEAFGALARRAGLVAKHVWLDPSGRMSMHWLDDRPKDGQEIDA